MVNIESAKHYFENSLSGVLSKNEIAAIWKKWIIPELFQMSLVDYYNKRAYSLHDDILVTGNIGESKIGLEIFRRLHILLVLRYFIF